MMLLSSKRPGKAMKASSSMVKCWDYIELRRMDGTSSFLCY